MTRGGHDRPRPPGPAAVVVTGVGLQTPAGAGLDGHLGRRCSPARSAARPDPAVRPVRPRGALRLRDPGLRPRAVPRAQGEPAGRPGRADRVRRRGRRARRRRRSRRRPGPLRGASSGTGIGGLITLEEQVKIYLDKGPDRVSPFFVPMMMANATAGIIGIHLGWTGPNLCITTACAAGANAIGEAHAPHPRRSADVVMAGGTEASLNRPAVAAFARMGALSKRNDEPELASRPFDADRDGFVMGEGAGMVVLERARPRRRPRRPHLRRDRRATARTATRSTSPRRPRAAPARPRACSSRSTTPASPPTTSVT